jgi:hypothetical protein
MKKIFKIKIGRAVWIALSLGILLIITGSLWYYRTQQAEEQQQLQTEQDAIQDRFTGLDVAQLQTEQQRLLNEVALANQSYSDMSRNISEPVDSITVSNRLFTIASSLNVQVTDINIANPHDAIIENIDCTVMPMAATVQGSLAALTEFVIKLKSDFGISYIERADFNIPDQASETVTSPSVNLSLAVYTFKGS